ncbi:hypothetical protein NB640_11475 [Oxalobacter vibrioformis]|uniref:Uncharacterized protein n=1 Tax=Oxalobacter vibrioformis TaxID=933080 RepID=A0A9E9P341_9BURK|nr:hypothetical protein [Oxalobacter vibrioformis]WAW09825.1 hypothetical protein NB640_11475 [Oxalobacter vibrioformis]
MSAFFVCPPLTETAGSAGAMIELADMTDSTLWHIYYSGTDAYAMPPEVLDALDRQFACSGCHFLLDDVPSVPDIPVLQKIPKNLDMAPAGSLLFGVMSERLRDALGVDITNHLHFGAVFLEGEKIPLPHYAFAGKGPMLFLRAERPWMMDGKPLSEARACSVCRRTLYGGLGKRYILREEVPVDVPVLWTCLGGLVIGEATKKRLQGLRFRGVRFEKIGVRDA